MFGFGEKYNSAYQILSSVFIVSFLGLMLQIAITRTFSTTIWYHYTFVAISVALFGWGLGGILLHFLKYIIRGDELTFVVWFSFILATFMPIYLLLISTVPASTYTLFFYFLISLVPFLIGGFCLAILYNLYTKSANKIYFADLAGASFASLIAEPVLFALGAESTILFLGIMIVIPGLLIAMSIRKKKLVALGLLGLVCLSTLFASNFQISFFNISDSPSKQLFQLIRNNPNLSISFTKWNSFSRIDVVEGFESNTTRAQIFIDADASTEVMRWDGNEESLQYLNRSLGMLPFCLLKNPRNLIIGPGGGKDVLIALVANSSKIIGVELNPIIVEVVQNYGLDVGYIYNNSNSKVKIIVDEGRSFISRTAEEFDVITLTLVDSWAAVYAGGYALAENYLYTKEAFIDYMDHLSPNGFLTMIRWESEVPRLISTITEAYTTMGEPIENIGRRLAVIFHEFDEHEPGRIQALVILKKSPFTPYEAEILQNQTSSFGSAYSAYYIPHKNDMVEPYQSLFNSSITLKQFYAYFPERVDAISDDSPYHFNFEHGVPSILSWLTILASSLIFGFIVIPLILKAGKRRKANQERSLLSYSLGMFILYFSALGIGYMLIEIALIQKFILFLGYPARAIAIILFSLLLSSGVGSFISGRFAKNYKALLKIILVGCPLIISITLVYIMFLVPLFAQLLAQNFLLRILVAIILLFPLGFFMGIPFPSGLRLLRTQASQIIPWMWGINGATSVLGSILATIIGILYGFSYAFLAGATAYLIPLIVSYWWFRKGKS